MPEARPTMPPLKLIGHVHRGFQRIADQLLRDQGFALGQLPVLMALKDGRPRSQAELARLAQVEQPSMAQLLNRMERDGLVERLPDPNDRRNKHMKLTQAGYEALAGMFAISDKLRGVLLKDIPNADIVDTDNFLAQLLERIEGGLAIPGDG